MNYLVRGQDVIFNLAGPGQSHRQHARPAHRPRGELPGPAHAARGVPAPQPGVKVVFAGTRQVYGRPDVLPVTEQHLVRPTDVNGINKVAGEYYHLVYNNVFGVRACSLRLTNVYGPRQLIRHNRQGFIGWFVRLALDRREIQIFGDGSQIRDFVYVEDAAEAFLRAGATDAVNGEVFNVGGNEHWSHRRPGGAAGLAGDGASFRFVEWPPEKKVIDIGSFYADSTKFQTATGWTPSVRLREGLERTMAFYRAHYDDYVAPETRRSIGVATRRRRDHGGDPRAVQRPAARATIARRSRRRSPGSSTAGGSCSAPKWRRSNASSRRRPAPRTPSASTPAPTPSPWRCGPSTSAPATR